MEQTSNAEKQARYRRKELLKRKADKLLKKWQLEPWKHHLKSIREITHLLEAAIRLPAGWTEEDYSNAETKLYHVYSEIVSPVNHVTNDVHESRNASEELGCSPNPSKFNDELTKAIENTNALASHIISALNLSNCSDADKASALMEVMRFVGVTLANNHVPRSQATAMCLAAISPIYGRPEWFYEDIAKIISHQHPELAYKISDSLNKYTNKPYKNN